MRSVYSYLAALLLRAGLELHAGGEVLLLAAPLGDPPAFYRRVR